MIVSDNVSQSPPISHNFSARSGHLATSSSRHGRARHARHCLRRRCRGGARRRLLRPPLGAPLPRRRPGSRGRAGADRGETAGETAGPDRPWVSMRTDVGSEVRICILHGRAWDDSDGHAHTDTLRYVESIALQGPAAAGRQFLSRIYFLFCKRKPRQERSNVTN